MLKRWLRKWLFAEELVKLQELDRTVTRCLESWEESIKSSQKTTNTALEVLDVTKRVIERNNKLIEERENLLGRHKELIQILESIQK